MTDSRPKLSRHLEEEDEKIIKAKRHEIQITTADVDIKLAEKLDSCLKVGGVSRPRFLTNKARDGIADCSGEIDPIKQLDIHDKIKPRNLTKDELKARLIKKYDSLVPELDPQRHNVKVVKILTANESIELGQNQAKKQLERQMQLNSVSGNQSAMKPNGLRTFKFNDGYEMPARNFMNNVRKSSIRSKLDKKSSKSTGATKSVKFATDVTFDESEMTEEELSDSDCSTDGE